jgi:hypothetical protein
MKLERIVTMTDSFYRCLLFPMVRSLRAVGCNLPVYVIPLNDERFDLPEGAEWWEDKNLSTFLQQQNAHPKMRKYQCLLIDNYHFVDVDLVFLKNPEEILKQWNGFITSCHHWHSPTHTYTADSLKYMQSKSTIWPHRVFNTGQFACDKALYTFEVLKQKLLKPDFQEACLKFPFHEQPGLNQLVFESGVDVWNLTLPPMRMESTWAGAYDENYESKWGNGEKKPYLLHYAGGVLYRESLLNHLFFQYMKKDEEKEWEKAKKWVETRDRREKSAVKIFWRKLKNGIRAFREIPV